MSHLFTKKINVRGGHRGFTLIELLVVIAIIGILASIILASLNSARQKGRDARRIADLKSIQLALELYFDSPASGQNSYPAGTSLAGLVSAYIPALPLDPLNSGVYIYEYQAANGAAACAAAPCTSYVLGAHLETDHQVLDTDYDVDLAGVECDTESATVHQYCVRP